MTSKSVGINSRNFLIFFVLVLAYFVSAKLGLKLAFVNASASAVWPPTGIAIASLLILGLRFWPAIFLGAFLANLTTAGTVLTSLGIATGNTLEGVVGAYLVARFAGGALVFERPGDIFKFAVLAGMISPLISAVIGLVSLNAGNLAIREDLWPVFVTWWLGDATGALIVAPFLIIWMTSTRPDWDLKKVIERGLLFLILFLVSQVVFGGIAISGVRNYPIDFLLFPVLLWIAFRFGIRATVTAAFLISIIAIINTLQGRGPFARENPNESLLLLQSFMAVVTITKLIVASVVAKSKELDRLKDEFLSMVSHELRTPLAAIKGFGAMIEAERYGEVPEGMKKPIKNVAKSADRLIILVNNLLEVSRLESGQIKPKQVLFSTNQVVAQVIEDLKPIADEKNINLVAEAAAIDKVKADPEVARQILENLVGNALKFTSEGQVAVSIKKSGKYINIYVTDTGEGIAGDKHSLIFDKFYQVKTAHHGRPSGTGLGLYLSFQMAKSMGGKLKLEKSEVGEGSVFVLSLPVVP